MSREVLMQVVERASKDASFRAQLESAPGDALAGYDLTADERAALLSGDAGRLQSLGVDVRMTKQEGGGPSQPGDIQTSPWAG